MKGVSGTGVIASMVGILLLTGCSESMVDGSPEERQTLVTQPAAGQQEVALVSSVKVGLPAGSYLLDDSSAAVVLYADDEPVAGEVISSDLEGTVTFQPKSQLAPNTQYRVVLGAWVAANGDIAEQREWHFTTVAELGATPQWVIDSCMADGDKTHLAELNRLRARGGQCGGEQFAPAAPLSWHCDLAYVAAEHAADQARMGLVGAQGSNGMGPVARLATTNIIWRGVAENDLVVAQGDSAVAVSLAAPEQCANLLTAELTHVGMASASTADGQGQAIWSQLFVQM